MKTEDGLIFKHYKLDKQILEVKKASFDRKDREVMNFLEILIDLYLSEKNLKLGNKSFLRRWISSYRDLIERSRKMGLTKILPTGESWSGINLACDLLNLYAFNSLNIEVLHKLFFDEHFFGARYEFLIASIFVKLGYRINWIVSTTGGKIPEFEATRAMYKLRVEAKSKNYRVDANMLEPYLTEKLQVEKFFKKALLKNHTPKVPFLIFYDINLPFTLLTEEQYFQYIENVKTAMLALRENEDFPHLFDYGYISNWSWHYHEKYEELRQQKINTTATPQNSFNPLSNRIIEEIENAAKDYGSREFRDKVINDI